MKNGKQSPQVKKKLSQNNKPPINKQNSPNAKELLKYPQYSQIQQSKIIHINESTLKPKPSSGDPHTKKELSNQIMNIPRSPKRDIASANPVLMSQIYSKSPPFRQHNSFLPLSRSIQKGSKSPILHIKVNPSVYINNNININIRQSLALPNRNALKPPINTKQSLVNYSKVSNHSSRSNQTSQKSIQNQPKPPSQPASQIQIQSQSSSVKEYSYQEEKNLEHRKTMEDFHQIVDNYCNDKSRGYFAIFDGHNGKESAVLCRDNLHLVLSKSLLTNSSNVEKSILYSFNKIDEELKGKLKTNDTGTTATIVLVIQESNEKAKTNQKVIYCANVGDSRCYLISKRGKVTKLTTEHKCSDTNEVERIRKAGGIVFSGRVFGTLALTRSLGDLEMKKYGVLNTPSISKHIINDTAQFCILASDGVWDVVTEEDMITFTKAEVSANDLCKLIVKTSIERDSRDNVSCIVIKL